jgi:lipopolysaccharide/colanic/teichoic acid biosynthesis glycosyltransferase
MYSKFFKRLFDIVISVVALGILSPVFLLVLILATLEFKGSPFFFQLRPGLNSRSFWIIKFKTLVDEEFEGQSDEQRLTLLGHWLRKTSLDELPQLFLVLRGHMSLVGPRPLLCEYLPLYSAMHSRRHNVKPGITGWAQVKGRNHLSWPEKLDLDIWYVDHLGFWTDLKILFLTAGKVVTGSGVEGREKVFVEKYRGEGECGSTPKTEDVSTKTGKRETERMPAIHA